MLAISTMVGSAAVIGTALVVKNGCVQGVRRLLSRDPGSFAGAAQSFGRGFLDGAANTGDAIFEAVAPVTYDWVCKLQETIGAKRREHLDRLIVAADPQEDVATHADLTIEPVTPVNEDDDFDGVDIVRPVLRDAQPVHALSEAEQSAIAASAFVAAGSDGDGGNLGDVGEYENPDEGDGNDVTTEMAAWMGGPPRARRLTPAGSV